ncbi:disulfide bond formation protein B [Rubellimicrobium roseum]|uniref:Disulfide bond formation protein B n=1 Tax=Rubellimicrobium roseum TaxID=687525 RepID=A0A5C4N7Y3_9RHOB|nr:disulfide bond formation protein B [Rubellimicrobium roseum]TNC69473.1 disulfide bond formation protein B [Rubellimicrobium roseum]
MTRTSLILAAAGGSAALLAGAYLFQALGYPPCPMCWWQRYPHFVAVAIGALALVARGPALPWLGAMAALTTSAIGVMHTGVERGWWTIQTSCTGGGDLGSLSGADLLSTEAPRIVMCDQVAWSLFGISMASWNAIFSAVLVVLWVLAARASATSRGVTRAA